ncbi:MAG: hypothetical protein U0Q07_10265 [Acidimicrobiales bacterium]
MPVAALALVVPSDADNGDRWTAALQAAAPAGADRPVLALDPGDDVDAVLQAAGEHAPAVIVLAAEVAEALVWDALARRAPAAAVVVVAPSDEAVDVALLSVDAVAAIVVDDGRVDLGRVGWGVLRAEAVLAPPAASALLDVTDGLTDDEQAVLSQLAEGTAPAAIADARLEPLHVIGFTTASALARYRLGRLAAAPG